MPKISATAETLASNLTGFHIEIGPCIDGMNVQEILGEERIAGDNKKADKGQHQRLMPLHPVFIGLAFLEAACAGRSQ